MALDLYCGVMVEYFLVRRIHSTVLGEVINFQEGYNITSKIEESVANGELQDVELFVFTHNMVF